MILSCIEKNVDLKQEEYKIKKDENVDLKQAEYKTSSCGSLPSTSSTPSYLDLPRPVSPNEPDWKTPHTHTDTRLPFIALLSYTMYF